jgi:hypothetical protein
MIRLGLHVFTCQSMEFLKIFFYFSPQFPSWPDFSAPSFPLLHTDKLIFFMDVLNAFSMD